ncbi:MAG: helix-turn-helix transcriptional regulator [Deltaproteobacteria bacterium]|nr:helix-turn-helix transcriptional regulator [Deltaproteobacteria bacterium]
MNTFANKLDRVVKEKFEGKARRFALAAGISETTLNSYFKRGSLPGVEILLKLAKAGGVTVDWLLTDEDESYKRKKHPSLLTKPHAEYGYSKKEREYVKMLIDILRGQNQECAEAIKSSIKAFWKSRDLASNISIHKKTKKAG